MAVTSSASSKSAAEGYPAAACQHRLASSGRPANRGCARRRGHFQRAPGEQLAANIGEIDGASRRRSLADIGRRAPLALAVAAASRRASGSLRVSTASVSDDTATTQRPATSGASRALAGGSRTPAAPSRRAAAAIGRTPRAGWMAPSSESSPSTTRSGMSRRLTTPCAARMPTLSGDRSRTRLADIRRRQVDGDSMAGNSKPELRMALLTRSRLSRTLASGRPTIVNTGTPNETSTSM